MAKKCQEVAITIKIIHAIAALKIKLNVL